MYKELKMIWKGIKVPPLQLPAVKCASKILLHCKLHSDDKKEDLLSVRDHLVIEVPS